MKEKLELYFLELSPSLLQKLWFMNRDYAN